MTSTYLIDATVTGPYAGIRRLKYQQRGNRGPNHHAATFVRQTFEPAVGADHAGLTVRQMVGGRCWRGDGIEFLDHEPTCHVARLVSAHAIGNRPQAAMRCDKVAVFVPGSDFANMRRSAGFEW